MRLPKIRGTSDPFTSKILHKATFTGPNVIPGGERLMPNDPSVAQLEDQKGFLSTHKLSEHIALKNEIQQRINKLEMYQKTKEGLDTNNNSLKQMFMTRL